MRILGVSAFYHDSAAALIEDGRVIAAAQEERFSRIKHDSAFPRAAIEYCLAESGCAYDRLDYVVFYDKPFLKFERLLETYLAFAPRGFSSFAKAIPVWLREKLFQKSLLLNELSQVSGCKDWEDRLLFSEHHLSHAASAFYPSPFDEAVILTMDGVGEWATTSVAYGTGEMLEVRKEIHFPHSLGLLYSAFTYYTGFKVNSGEYKLMGLAPYGSPRFTDLIHSHLIDLKDDGSFRLDQRYFDYCTGLTMTNARFEALFGQPARPPESEITQFHMDVAASIQAVTEEIVLKIVEGLAAEHDCRNLCLAGGVALNCVANGRVTRESRFENFWIQPASGDAGGAVGAALAAYHHALGQSREVCAPDGMSGGYLGPEFDQGTIESTLTEIGASYSVLTEGDVVETTARAIAEDRVVGWMQGRMEFGPRSLGNRSILGNAQSATAQRQINLKIKYRESFRPFAPSIPAEFAHDWFGLRSDSPYMLLTADVLACHRLEPGEDDSKDGLEAVNQVRSVIPAVTHVDWSARVQTVSQHTNPLFHTLLNRVGEITGVPVVVNTSFNVRGEPVVCTPIDAFRCFMGTEMDLLVIGRCVLEKACQPDDLKRDYAAEYELD